MNVHWTPSPTAIEGAATQFECFVGLRGYRDKDRDVKIGFVNSLPEGGWSAWSRFATGREGFENEAEARDWVRDQFGQFYVAAGLVPRPDMKLPEGRNAVEVAVDTSRRYEAGEIVLARVLIVSPPEGSNDTFRAISPDTVSKPYGRTDTFALGAADILGRVGEREAYGVGDAVLSGASYEYRVEGFHGDDFVILKDIKNHAGGLSIKKRWEVWKKPPLVPDEVAQ